MAAFAITITDGGRAETSVSHSPIFQATRPWNNFETDDCSRHLPVAIGVPTMKSTPNLSRLFILLRIAMILSAPVLSFIFLYITIFTTPNLETWLQLATAGRQRADAFEGLNAAASVFTLLFCCVSLCITICIITARLKYVATLLSGNVIGSLCYLCAFGIFDPAWSSLLAMNSLGMFVSIVASAAWVVRSESNSTKRVRVRQHKPED